MEIIKPEIIGISYSGDTMTAQYAQRVGHILNRNADDRKSTDDNWKRDADMKLVGRIPKTVYILWKELGILDDERELDKALERHKEWKTTEKTLI